MLTLSELAYGLNMDKSNLSKLIKKLQINPGRIRGKRHQWASSLDTEQIDQILEHREGIPHNLKKTKKGYSVDS